MESEERVESGERMEVDKRYLIRRVVLGYGAELDVLEIRCLQISPSGKYVRVKYVTKYFTEEWLGVEQIQILEALPPRSITG